MKCEMAADQVLKRFSRQIIKEDASRLTIASGSVRGYVFLKVVERIVRRTASAYWIVSQRVAPSWRHGNRCGSSCRENKVVTVARWQNGLSARLVWK